MPEANKKYALSTAAGKTDEIIEIGGREFHGWALTLAESNTFRNTTKFDDQLEKLTKPLERRALDSMAVDSKWLAEQIDQPFLTKMMKFLVNGTLEGDDPKA